MTKRERIYNKFGGLCAYSGTPLEDDWQIDHVIPKCSYLWDQTMETKALFEVFMSDPNDDDNLLPCNKMVNHYKRSLDLDGFRKYMETFHIRLSKLPKNTKVEATKRRKEYMFKVASYFGITPEKPFNGKFYFETI